jgi:hypothetical protein
MAITNYGELKTAVGTWINRADLSSYIPDFIVLGASRIYYGSKDSLLPSEPVRTRAMQTSHTPTITSAAFDLPTRYLATYLLRGTSGTTSWQIDYIAPASFAEYYNNSADDASYYTIIDNQIVLSSSATTSVTHHYYARYADFSGDTDTNALLTDAPALWLWAAILEANIFTGADEDAKKAHRMYMSISTGLNANARDLGGAALTMRAR